MSTLGKALSIAAHAHDGQVDKAGAPYILHVLRVMMKMASDEERIVAVLHDVVEDTAWTLERLQQEGFSPRVVEAIDCLTRRANEGYEDFIERVASLDLSTRVKLADLEDNCDVSRLESRTAEDYERLAKYRRAVARLRALRPEVCI